MKCFPVSTGHIPQGGSAEICHCGPSCPHMQINQSWDKVLTVPQDSGPPWKRVQAILTTSASIFRTPGKISGWRGLLHAKSPYTCNKASLRLILKEKQKPFLPFKNSRSHRTTTDIGHWGSLCLILEEMLDSQVSFDSVWLLFIQGGANIPSPEDLWVFYLHCTPCLKPCPSAIEPHLENKNIWSPSSIKANDFNHLPAMCFTYKSTLHQCHPASGDLCGSKMFKTKLLVSAAGKRPNSEIWMTVQLQQWPYPHGYQHFASGFKLNHRIPFHQRTPPHECG